MKKRAYRDMPSGELTLQSRVDLLQARLALARDHLRAMQRGHESSRDRDIWEREAARLRAELTIAKHRLSDYRRSLKGGR